MSDHAGTLFSKESNKGTSFKQMTIVQIHAAMPLAAPGGGRGAECAEYF